MLCRSETVSLWLNEEAFNDFSRRGWSSELSNFTKEIAYNAYLPGCITTVEFWLRRTTFIVRIFLSSPCQCHYSFHIQLGIESDPPKIMEINGNGVSLQNSA